MIEKLVKNGPQVSAEIVVRKGVVDSVELALRSKPGFAWAIDADAPSVLAAQHVSEWMQAYASKRPQLFDGRLAWHGEDPSFDTCVWQELSLVRFGDVVSYSELARRIGHPRAARAVGSACGRNRCLLLIPCHRVIAKDGSLGGFAIDLEIKKRLLSCES